MLYMPGTLHPLCISTQAHSQTPHSLAIPSHLPFTSIPLEFPTQLSLSSPFLFGYPSNTPSLAHFSQQHTPHPTDSVFRDYYDKSTPYPFLAGSLTCLFFFLHPHPTHVEQITNITSFQTTITAITFLN